MLMPLVVPATSLFSAINLRSSRCFIGLKALALTALLAVLTCLAPAANAQTNFTVNSLGDTGTGSGNSGDLRYAITQANAASGNNSIEFAVTGTISLTSALPQITSNATIIGSGPKVLTISGANSYQVFNIASSATVTINGMTIANGSAGNAGAILNAGALTVENVAFSGNYANVYGGAIWNTGMLTVDGVAFSGNRCGVRGGAIFNSGSGLLKVSNSTFSGNTAFDDGGAIAGVNLTVTNSTFSGNSATYSTGGAIFAQGSTLTVTNSTFSGNSASNQGGGIYAGAGTTTVNNSIFTGNYAVTDGGIFNTHTLNGSYNVLGADINGECGGTGCLTDGVNGNQVGVPAASIGLLPLGNYGGPTETMALAPGSAAICAGLKADAVDAGSNPLAFDERGFAMDPTCSSSNVDAGAVQTNQYVVNSLIDSGDGSDNCNPIGTGTTCSLRDAIGDENSSGGDITFLPSLTSTSTPGTINLSSLVLGTGTGLTLGRGNILGPGANQLTISGDADTSVGSVLTVTSGGQAFLYGLTISGGYSENSPGGGGIYNQGTLTTMASAISGNLTDNGLNGAGIVNSGTLTLTGSTVSGNQILFGSGSGGGIYSTGTLTLNESTVAFNTVPFQSTGGGGGIFVAVGSLTLTGSTVSGNSTAVLCPGGPSCLGGNGGGIYNGGTLTAENSIVAGNTTMGTANSGDCVNCGTPGSSNLIGGAPELSGLQSNGVGATVQTMIPLPGSPAICAGFGGYVPSWITTDERGFPLYPTGGYCALGVVDSGAVQTNYTGVQFNQQPTNTNMGSFITPAPTVAILETDTLLSANNTDAVNGVPISLTYSDGASNLITGTLMQTTAGGVATYGDLVPQTGPATASLSTSIPVYGSVTLTATSDGFEVIGPATSFVISTPGAITAGIPSQYTITTRDDLNNTVTGYSGTVTITSSDTAVGVVLPSSTTIVNGLGTFTATLITGGYQTIEADDVANSIIGETDFYVDAAAPVSLSVTQYPTTWYAGATAQVFITASDQYGNQETPFTGPVSVTTSDSAATVTQFTPYEDGVVAYSVVFATQGTQSISATSAGLTGGSQIGITIGTMPSFVVTVGNDTTDGQDTASDCTDQSQPGATPDASCSVRDAVWAAGFLGAGNVTFSPSVFNVATTITLTSPDSSSGDFGALPLGSNVSITGPIQGTTNLVTIKGPVAASPATGSAVFYAYGAPFTGPIFGPDSLVNLNIANGDGTMATGDGSGTGGVNSEADLTVTNCSFTANMGDTAGAIYNYSGNLTINGGTFSGNSSTGLDGPDAGAIFSDTMSGTPKFVKDHPFISSQSYRTGASAEVSTSKPGTKSGIFGTAVGGRAGFASRVRPMGGHKSGALQSGHSAPLSGNSPLSTTHGSRLATSLSGIPFGFSIPLLTVTNSTFTNNSGVDAGAIFNESDEVSITGSVFTNNSAPGGSGALLVDDFGYTSVSNSTFSGNVGGYTGAVFSVDSGEAQVMASTINSNTSTGDGSSGPPYPDGGAVNTIFGGYAFLGYDTITNNSSTSGMGAGAIMDLGSIGGYVAAFNTTITGNSGFYGAMFDDSGDESDVENTVASGNTTSDPTASTDGISPDSNGMQQYGGNVITDPNVSLSTLGNFGGPTQTMLPLPGSSAICAGLEGNLANAYTYYGVTLTTDQRGDPNLNATYRGSLGRCVDAGSDETNYAIGFSIQPPSTMAVGGPLSTSPVVSLTESGLLVAVSGGTVTMTDSDRVLTGTLSETFASGAASFDNLIIPRPVTGDTLQATTALTPSINLTAKSSAVAVTSALPWVLLSSTSLDYGTREIGVISPSQQVTLRNIGETALSISSIAVTGGDASSFVFANGCGASLAAGTSCAIHGHFTPTTTGPLSGAITITDNDANGTTQSISLSGTGQTGPPLPLTAVSLSYGNQVVGTTSASQSVTMTNTSGSPISISSITVTGANASSFIFANSCGTGLAVGTSCTIHGHFTPTTSGPLSAAVIITDNDPSGGTESISLSGTGVTPPAVSLSSTSLSYGNKLVGATSASQSVTLTNTGGLPLLISSIAVTGPDASSFIVANSCGTSVAAGASCTIHGHFTPTTTGPLTAAVTITDNASDSPQSISLSGHGN